jgi:hypothetical protein
MQPYRGFWICDAHVGQFMWKQGLQYEYLVLLLFICAEVVRRTLSFNFEFRPLFHFADAVFP